MSYKELLDVKVTQIKLIIIRGKQNNNNALTNKYSQLKYFKKYINILLLFDGKLLTKKPELRRKSTIADDSKFHRL